ncbi:penicillin-binding protein [Pedobacter sp. HMF7647]|uniref:Penicillin-binding protein n=1 Tax=Hufsiella arboris TaxID=2695275 RepID=A0A7K1Y602_9SPHI|nr:biosynthetic peptidoglycan transglycosylase [Hufsiella arboris]MXV49841.1 penicillin-binding protein [Hufsiella arboris]
MNIKNLRINISKKHLKIAGVIVAGIILLMVIGGVIAYKKREAILQVEITKAIAKAKRDYHLDVKIQSAHFDGLKSVLFKDISIVPENRDSLASIQTLHVGVKFFPLLFGNVSLSEVKLYNGKITLIKKDSIRNYDFLFRNKKDTTAQKPKTDLSELADNLLNRMLNKVPDNMDVKNFEISYRGNKGGIRFFTPTATIDGGELKSTIDINDKESVWHIDGSVDPGDKQFDVKLYAEGKKIELPFIEKKYNLKLNFDTAHAELKKITHSGDGLVITGSCAIKNLLINHPKIAANDVVVPDGSIDADLLIGENFVSIEKSSVIHLKKITANPFMRYTLFPKKVYEVKLHTDEMDAQQLFDSFPQGMFESLEGVKVAGKLQYDLNFYLDTTDPDNVQFDSRMNQKGFRVVSYGKTDLSKINGTFVYTPYEYGKPMRDITIGPSNRDFTPIGNISSNLKNALLTAEDPSFFSHHGFVEESIRKSIATDFKEKSFKRGASTISMQLVKNVYLNRQKTMARKIEEILITWMIENGRLSNKQRMFEVYLNLIEWGRNVYGIGEASRYYFGKSPSELTQGEGIFLASIVPRPKKGLYFFEPDGSLRTGLRGYFKLIGNLMAKKGLTERDTNAYGFYSVRLKESLRQQIAPADTAVSDSTLMLDDEDSQSFLERIFTGKKEHKADSLSNEKTKSQPDTSQTKVEETRQQRRERRKLEKEERKKAQEQGHF